MPPTPDPTTDTSTNPDQPTAQQIQDNTNAMNANTAQMAASAQQAQPTQQSATEAFQAMLVGLPPNLIQQLTAIATPYISTTTPPQEVMLNIEQSPQFQSMFPGIQKAINNGYPPPSLADYLSYEQTAYSLAQAAGIPKDVIAADIPDLIGNNVSPSELAERINNGYAVAMQSDPQTRSYLEQNFGVTNGDLAAFYLNPDAAIKTLEQETTASQIAGAGENAGFAPISVSRAMQLAQLGVSQSAAVSGFKQIGGELPLTTPWGMTKGGPGVISQDQLVGSEFVGDYTSTRAVQLAQETRKAPIAGGGGFATEGHGTAVGSGTEQGLATTS